MYEQQYVLTLDYTLKILNIHERYKCGIPVIIEGETGVGKTALIEILSQLWNSSWLSQWDREKNHIILLMKKRLEDLSIEAIDDSKRDVCLDTVHKLNASEEVSEEMLHIIAQLPDASSSGHFYTVLNESLMKLEKNLILAMLDVDSEALAIAFEAIHKGDRSPKCTAHLMHILFRSKLKNSFYKLNVHAALLPKDIEDFFKDIFEQACGLKEAYDACDPTKRLSFQVPFVTAYLDEINTASCLGLFKEIIVDRTIDGNPIPQNVFIVASCNPHRGDILSAFTKKDQKMWLKGTYYVRKLHPTLEFLMWDYGSLNKHQEREYVNAKMEMLNQRMSSENVESLTNLIVDSQQKMREYASDQLQASNVKEDVSKLCAKSCVSQRDIQRVFTFYQWLMKLYTQFNQHNELPEKYHRRAVMVSLGVAYFMRLDTKYRNRYQQYLDHFDRLAGEITFSEALKEELEWFIEQVKLPASIAKTRALQENVFATIACAVTHTPLIIVGDPGSSKTLSFNVVIANLKGKESKMEVFRCTDVFKSLDPHFYQCSRRTTSNEVGEVFTRASNRQRSLANVPLPVYCVVFMDEAGLPEDKLESLKILHHHLDRQEVSFVAISNHVLDAAKTNRAVSLFRPKATDQELFELAKVSIVLAGKKQDIQEKQVKSLCYSFSDVLAREEFCKYYGLRDFIHFVTYLRHKYQQFLDPQVVLEALERNFNGSKQESFKKLCGIFFSQIGNVEHNMLKYRSIIDILKDSLADHTRTEGDDIHSSIQNEVRYKLIIDPSEDDSLVRLLFRHGVLQRETTRLYICSDFPADSQLRVRTIAQIRHSVAMGHTILMCQTDEIHESFYDLFNQRFRSIEDPKHGTRYYTNIAIGAHSKPCPVDPNFQCVVVIKESEVEHTPPPFLNRFEKYYLTHRSLLETVLSNMPPCLRILLQTAYSKAAEFISIATTKPSNLYGYKAETLDSLMLSLLPPVGHTYSPLLSQESFSLDSEESEDVHVFILQTLLGMLQRNAGFHIPQYQPEVVRSDANYIFKIILSDPEFKEVMPQIHRKDVAVLIDEALHVLHHGPKPTDKHTPFEIYTDACMVIAVLTQWIVGYLCKQLMQLMTPEALTVHCNDFPTVYIQNYLTFQEHFSLKELVHTYIEQQIRNKWDSTVCPTKLLCFTRSSPLIHQLPAEYPGILAAESGDEHYGYLENYIFANCAQLMIHKVSLENSQGKLEKMLTKFIDSDCTLLLLIANMQEISPRMVNHLRIMIEEAESKIKNCSKLFVCLLHFPPVMFFQSCYPTLFLQGWGHHYLDTIARGTLTSAGVKAIVDVKTWLYHCCFPETVPPGTNDDYFVEGLQNLLQDAIPIIASRVSFISLNENGTFKYLDASQGTRILKELLNQKGLGRVLCTKFRIYWTPKVMVKHIERVSMFMYDQESTLNITDSTQSIVRSSFFDFLVYMFIKMNEELYINIIRDENCPIVLNELFQKLLQALPVPDLTQLKVLTATLRPQCDPKKVKHHPKFPFFKYICEMVEKVVDESREEVNQKINIHSEDKTGTQEVNTSLFLMQRRSRQQMEEIYKDVVISRLKENLKQDSTGCLAVALAAIDSDPKDIIWNFYIDDFARYKLHLESKISKLTNDILKAYIGHLYGSSALTRMVSLHVHLQLHQLNLSKLTGVLRPISRIEKEMEYLPYKTEPAKLTSLMSPELIGNSVLWSPTLATFTVDMLFKSLSSPDGEELHQWYRSYNDIMTIPAMREDILSNLTPDIEKELNIMHATYLVMQCCCDSAKGYQAFKTLQELKLCPRLRKVVDTGLLIIPYSSKKLQFYMEGLFAFFFSNYRTTFNEEDCQFFLELANQQDNFCHSSAQVRRVSESVADAQHSCASLSIFKLYLSRVLGESQHEIIRQDPQKREMVMKVHVPRALEESELLLHNPKRRQLVGSVLTVTKDLGFPGPYIPTFYQLEKNLHIHACEGSKLTVMQQPLAHLYFMTILEHLQSRRHFPNHLVRLAGRISMLLKEDSTSVVEKVLLFIEKQAVVQVLIQRLAIFFDPKNPKKVQDLFNARLIQGVTPLLSDETMGGSATAVSGHGLVLALHLLKQLNSPRAFAQMLQDEQSTLVTNFSCVKPLQHLIQVKLKSEAHLFPFIGPEKKSSELGHFYQQIYRSMINIHNSAGSQTSVDELVQLAQDSEHKLKFTSTTMCVLYVSKRNAFRMLAWLCAYYRFFVEKVQSRILADVISNAFRGVFDTEFIGLLQSFIYPQCMIHDPEIPPEMNENAQTFQITEDLPLQRKGNKKDPIFELFNPPTNSKPDLSDVELCHAMANMVAVVLACEPHSNHLWYHLFAVNSLSGSFMTGFMHNGKICKDLPYDCGVELSSDGTYGRPDYLSHATRGTLSLHSLYLILWANFSAFSMALLTQPDAREKISGPIISSCQPIRHLCVMQVRSVWLHMNNHLKLSLEEQSFFMMQCMQRVLEVNLTDAQSIGIFQTREELDSYEKTWHELIYTQSYTNLHEKFAEYCQLCENVLFKDLRFLETRYPHFPEMDEFSQAMLSSVDISNIKNDLYVLSKFALEYPRLEAAGALLPDLMEFYQWIHIELAYRMTHKYAENHTIQEVISKEDQEYKRVTAEKEFVGFEPVKLYERVKAGYNKYVEVIGKSIGFGTCANVNRKGKIYKIEDNTTFLHLVSEEGDGVDWLHIVIADIIDCHNRFLEGIFDAVEMPEHSELRAFFPETVRSCIFPNEVNEHVMIVGKPQRTHGIDEQVHLIRSRYLQFGERTQDPNVVFDLHLLQKDVVKTHLVGKPLIDEYETFRIPFRFRAEIPPNVTLGGADLNLSVISEYIKEDSGFRIVLNTKQVKELECEFHSANYHVLDEVVTGLRIATEHLIKSINLPEENIDVEDLREIKLPAFLKLIFNTNQEEMTNMMEAIRITNLSPSQMACLLSLKLPYLYCTLELFVLWIRDGMYDFHDLPLRMKRHLEPADGELLNKIYDNVHFRDPSVLLHELQSLTDVLVHSEPYLRKTNVLDKNLHKSIVVFLRDLDLYGLKEKEKQLARFIPSSVQCQHYVAFRVALRRQVAQVQGLISAITCERAESKQWVDFAHDLWTEEGLKHLRVVASPFNYYDHPFEFDPNTQLYGFQDGIEEEEPLLYIHSDEEQQDSQTSFHEIPPGEIQSLAWEEEPSKPSPSLPATELQLREAAETLTIANITEFLKKWKLDDKYAKLFADNHVDGPLLYDLSENDLKDLGVMNGFDRRKILTKFEQHLQLLYV